MEKERERLNENWFTGGYLGPGLGSDWTLTPASYTVQGSATGYVYSLHTFDDTLQQKPNPRSDEYYIYPGCMVRGVGYNHSDKHYTGTVMSILKNGKGEIIALKILAKKTSTPVHIRADENLELLLPEKPQPIGDFRPIPTEMQLNNTNGNVAAE